MILLNPFHQNVGGIDKDYNMEAPTIRRHPNVFTTLPREVCEMIGEFAGGRAFVRLGACSFMLRNIVLKAERAWKEIYIDNNWGKAPDRELPWRESCITQELIKRNAIYNNYTHHFIPYMGVRVEEKGVFAWQEHLFFNCDPDILVFDREGKYIRRVGGDFKSLIFRKQAGIEDVDQLESGVTKGVYDDKKIVYQRSDATIWWMERTTKVPIKLEGINPESTLIGLHSDNLYILHGTRLTLFSLESNTAEFYENEGIEHSHPYFIETSICFYISHNTFIIFDCKSKSFKTYTFEGIEGVLYFSKKYVFHVIGGRIERWDTTTTSKEFTLFAEVPTSCDALFIEGDRLTARWGEWLNNSTKRTTLMVWNIKTKKLVSTLLPGDLAKSNLLLLAHSLPLDFQNYGIIKNWNNEEMKVLCNDRGLVVCKSNKLWDHGLHIFDFTQPLPKKNWFLNKIGF